MTASLQRKCSYGLFGVGIILMMTGLSLFAGSPVIAQNTVEYMGVRDCNDCHGDTARNHAMSIHAGSLVDPEEDPELIKGDFESENDLLTIPLSENNVARRITLEDIAFAIGAGRHKQHYLVEVSPDTYRVLPIAWNIETASWEALTLAADWSAMVYNWNQSCANCHVTGYNPESGQWVDDGVQCEACHGAGETHVELADELGWDIDDEGLALLRESIIAAPDEQTCATCHNVTQFDGVHQPMMDLINGMPVIDGITGKATAHSYAEDAPTCLTCHFRTGTNEDEPVTLHDMQITPNEHVENCMSCHTELTVAYAQRFLTTQREDTTQRLAVIQSVLIDTSAPAWVSDATQLLLADASGGIHNVAYNEALLNAVELELGLVQSTSLFGTTESTDPGECAECHATEHTEWLNSSHALTMHNEHFQSVYAQSNQPTYCLRCHASGFDAPTQSIAFEGVVCSSCHVIEGEHPPAPATMGTNVTTCATCHSGGHASVYEEWLAGEHQVVGVDCVDCHNAHTNEMLLGDVNTTCGDCHADAMNDEVHMGADLICTDCHMTPRQDVIDPTMLSLTGHSMDISPGVCADCHGAIHSLEIDEADSDDNDEKIVLQEDLEKWQATAEDNLTSGLLGGAIGVLLVLGLVYFVLRLGRTS